MWPTSPRACTSVRLSVRPLVRPSLRQSVRSSVRPSARSSVPVSVRSLVCRPRVRPSVRPSVRPCVHPPIRKIWIIDYEHGSCIMNMRKPCASRRVGSQFQNALPQLPGRVNTSPIPPRHSVSAGSSLTCYHKRTARSALNTTCYHKGTVWTLDASGIGPSTLHPARWRDCAQRR